jgi:serine/threonine protein kinase
MPWLSFYLDKLHWDRLSANPSAMSILENNLDRVDWKRLSCNPAALSLLEQHPDNIDWAWLSNNPAAMKLWELHLDKVDWAQLSRNPSAVPLLLQYPDRVEWRRASCNLAAQLLWSQHPDKIDWIGLSSNEAGMSLLTHNPDRVCWDMLSGNPAAISLLKQNPDRVHWASASRNPEARVLLETFITFVDWYQISYNGKVLMCDPCDRIFPKDIANSLSWLNISPHRRHTSIYTTVLVDEEHITIPQYAYDLHKSIVLGQGTFGIVVSASKYITSFTQSAVDSICNVDVAIKRMRPYNYDKDLCVDFIYEMRMLKLLRFHPHVVHLHDVYMFSKKFELYLVMERMQMSLSDYLKNNRSPFNPTEIRHMMMQMLCVLHTLEQFHICHCDVKSNNILINAHVHSDGTRIPTLKLADFGFAKYIHVNNAIPNHLEVVTIYYRPPELMLCDNRIYAHSIDMWSLGCVLYEMLTGNFAFCNRTESKMLCHIFSVFNAADCVLGYTPNMEYVPRHKRKLGMTCPLKNMFNEHNQKYFLKGVHPDFMDLLLQMMSLNPNDRPTASALYSSLAEHTPHIKPYVTMNVDLQSTFAFASEAYQSEHSLDHLIEILTCEVEDDATNTERVSASTTSS